MERRIAPPMGSAITVLGPVPAADLGVTLMHEHLFVDLGVWFSGPVTPDAERPVEMSMLGALRRDAFAITRDNLRLQDPKLAEREAQRFRAAGGRTVVEVTPAGLARDPNALARLAERTGLHVIMGCGYYVDAAHPPIVREQAADDIAADLISEITAGVGDTGIRPGIIGEIGTSGVERGSSRKRGDITRDEEKTLRGAARAAVTTGIAVSVHLDPRGQGGDKVLDVLLSEGVSPERIILGHLDHVPDLDYHRRLADRGPRLQYDNFGREYYWDAEGVYWNNDQWRVDALIALTAAGHVDQLLVSQDVAFKMDLREFGGLGYDHILVDIVPQLRRGGLTENDVQCLLVDNPRRILCPGEVG